MSQFFKTEKPQHVVESAKNIGETLFEKPQYVENDAK